MKDLLAFNYLKFYRGFAVGNPDLQRVAPFSGWGRRLISPTRCPVLRLARLEGGLPRPPACFSDARGFEVAP